MSTLQLPGSSYSTEVNLNGLIEVLSKHLYSTPVVAVRELVQNGHDAIVRRRIEQPDAPKDNQIRVVVDVAKSTITITDTGAGLTESEIHGFLATVGVGYTRMLRQQDDNTGLIGMFGLGFLSAFVLAKEVTVLTTSSANAGSELEIPLYRRAKIYRYAASVLGNGYAGDSDAQRRVQPSGE